MSFKDEVRKSIIAITALAVATSFFTGCNSAQDIEDNDVYGPDLSTPVDESNSNTDIVIDDKTPGGAPTDVDTSGESSTSTGDIVGPAASDGDTSTSEDNSEPDNTSTGDVADTGDPSDDPDTSGNTSEPSGDDSNNSAPSSSNTTKPDDNTSQPGSPSTPSNPNRAQGVYEPPLENGRLETVTGLPPSDTTGWELDSNGFPTDVKTWKAERGKYFVHASGQLYVVSFTGKSWTEQGTDGGGAGSNGGAGPSGKPVGWAGPING